MMVTSEQINNVGNSYNSENNRDDLSTSKLGVAIKEMLRTLPTWIKPASGKLNTFRNYFIGLAFCFLLITTFQKSLSLVAESYSINTAVRNTPQSEESKLYLLKKTNQPEVTHLFRSAQVWPSS